MKENQYHDLEKHKIKHKKFASDLKILRKKLKSDKSELALEIRRFISNWIVGHILIEDMKYASHCKDLNSKNEITKE